MRNITYSFTNTMTQHCPIKGFLLYPDKPFTICKRVASCRGLLYGDSISLFCVYPCQANRGSHKKQTAFLICVCLGGLLHRPLTGRPVIKNSTFKPEQTNESLNNNTGSSSPEYLLICQREKRREAIVYNGVDDTFRIFTYKST